MKPVALMLGITPVDANAICGRLPFCSVIASRTSVHAAEGTTVTRSIPFCCQRHAFFPFSVIPLGSIRTEFVGTSGLHEWPVPAARIVLPGLLVMMFCTSATVFGFRHCWGSAYKLPAQFSQVQLAISFSPYAVKRKAARARRQRRPL